MYFDTQELIAGAWLYLPFYESIREQQHGFISCICSRGILSSWVWKHQ